MVALSLVFPLDERRLQSELETLRHALPLSVVILAGGSAAPACSGPLTRLGIRVVLSQTALRSVLRTIHVPRKA